MQRCYPWLLAGVLAFAVSALAPAQADIPAGWKNVDVGDPDPPGSTEVTGTGPSAIWKITGTGNDIWGSADQFQFAYTDLPGDGGITARLLSQEGGHSDGWAKTGTMLREDLDPGARFAMMPYENGIAAGAGTQAPDAKFQPSYRMQRDTQPVDIPGVRATAGRRLEDGGPIWIRTQRQGQVYQHLLSDDGKSWKLITSATLDIPAGTPILAGLCATMHGGDVPVVATFDNVSVTADVISTAPGPRSVAATPSAGAVLLTFDTVPNAVGYNVYRQSPTDAVAAKVNAEPTPYSWYVDTGLTNGTAYRYTVRAVFKAATGELTESADSPVVLAEPQVPLAPGFLSYDIGTQTPGRTVLEGGVLTITASGAGIVNEADSMRFVAMPMFADYTLTAKILEKPNPGDGNTAEVKAGVMIRETLSPGSANAAVLASTTRGVILQWRRGFRMTVNDSLNDAPGLGQAAGTDVDTTQYPQWLRITRAGINITGFQSEDGSNFDEIGQTDFPTMGLTTYAGLAVSAGNEGRLATAKFDAASVTVQ